MPREQAIEAIAARSPADVAVPAAPGTSASHYAPRASSSCAGRGPGRRDRRRDGPHRRVSAALEVEPAPDVVVRAVPDDDAGMARELYAALRDLDAAGVDVVIAALPPAAGLGEAVGDRLRRASGPRDPRS
ncbi:MAG: hypothetical protein KIT31_20575 [Deltaproteobacteria bacterium]|nr:hypothetical protein [Deltaproteobacteria bacterium]